MVLEITKLQKQLIFLILMGQILFQGVMLPFISMPFYLFCMILLSIITFCKWLSNTKGKISKDNKIAITILLSAINIILVYLLNSIINTDRIFLIVTSCFFCLACFDIIKSEDDRKWLIRWFIIFALVSAVVEIGQVLQIDVCYQLWMMTHQGEHLNGSIASERYLGLSPTILHFAYTTSAAMALTLFYRFEKHNLLKKIFLCLIFIIAILTNNTRSSIIVMIFAFASWLLFDNSARNISIIYKLALIGLIIVAASFAFQKMDILYSSRLGSNEGGDLRISMFLTGINHMIHHPFGMGNYVVESNLIIGIGNVNKNYIQEVGAHNIICNCGASYGFIGLFLLARIYYLIIKEYTINKFNSPLCFPSLVALIGLLINAFFHNWYIFSGELISYMLIAIICSCKTEDTYEI